MQMRTVLWGREHTELGEIATARVGDRAGLALSRGGHPKAYSYTEPNEDVVAAVDEGGAILLVCADGHYGTTASHVAVQAVLDAIGDAPRPLDDDEWLGVFAAANTAAVSATQESGQPASRTVLVAAVAQGPRLSWAAMGDSALVVARPGRRGRQLNRERMRFVGSAVSREALAGNVQRGEEELGEGEWVVLVTDGLAEFVIPQRPSDVIPASLKGEPEDAAEADVRTAFAAGAGDNVGCAVLAP